MVQRCNSYSHVEIEQIIGFSMAVFFVMRLHIFYLLRHATEEK